MMSIIRRRKISMASASRVYRIIAKLMIEKGANNCSPQIMTSALARYSSLSPELLYPLPRQPAIIFNIIFVNGLLTYLEY